MVQSMIRISVIRILVIRCSVIHSSVICILVIHSSVIYGSVIHSSVIHGSVISTEKDDVFASTVPYSVLVLKSGRSRIPYIGRQHYYCQTVQKPHEIDGTCSQVARSGGTF